MSSSGLLRADEMRFNKRYLIYFSWLQKYVTSNLGHNLLCAKTSQIKKNNSTISNIFMNHLTSLSIVGIRFGYLGTYIYTIHTSWIRLWLEGVTQGAVSSPILTCHWHFIDSRIKMLNALVIVLNILYTLIIFYSITYHGMKLLAA